MELGKFVSEKDGKSFFSIVDAKQHAAMIGGSVISTATGQQCYTAETPPDWICDSCAAENHAFTDEMCWCCGDQKVTNLGIKTNI